MLRLLDANVFIAAKNTYYDFDLVPAFWTWLEHQADVGTLASTDLIYRELRAGGDDLANWIGSRRDAMFHVSSASPEVARHVASLDAWARGEGYRDHVVEDFMSCADPFLVGVAAESGSTIVTLERPAGASKRKVKIPDACDHLGVSTEDTFEMMRILGARFE